MFKIVEQAAYGMGSLIEVGHNGSLVETTERIRLIVNAEC